MKIKKFMFFVLIFGIIFSVFVGCGNLPSNQQTVVPVNDYSQALQYIPSTSELTYLYYDKTNNIVLLDMLEQHPEWILGTIDENTNLESFRKILEFLKNNINFYGIFKVFDHKTGKEDTFILLNTSNITIEQLFDEINKLSPNPLFSYDSKTRTFIIDTKTYTWDLKGNFYVIKIHNNNKWDKYGVNIDKDTFNKYNIGYINFIETNSPKIFFNIKSVRENDKYKLLIFTDIDNVVIPDPKNYVLNKDEILAYSDAELNAAVNGNFISYLMLMVPGDIRQKQQIANTLMTASPLLNSNISLSVKTYEKDERKSLGALISFSNIANIEKAEKTLKQFGLKTNGEKIPMDQMSYIVVRKKERNIFIDYVLDSAIAKDPNVNSPFKITKWSVNNDKTLVLEFDFSKTGKTFRKLLNVPSISGKFELKVHKDHVDGEGYIILK